MNEDISVNDQALILITSELATLMGAYAIAHKNELEDYGDRMMTLASNIMAHDVPTLLKLAKERKQSFDETEN